MDNSPSSYSRKELWVAFYALYVETIKMAKKNMKLKNSIKKAIWENEALKQRVASMENNVAHS